MYLCDTLPVHTVYKSTQSLGPKGLCTQLDEGARVMLHSLASTARLNGQVTAPTL